VYKKAVLKGLKLDLGKAEPFDNVIGGSSLEVGEISVGSKRAPIDERIGYRVREAYLEEWSPMAEVTIDSIRPVVGSVPRGDSVGRASGRRSSGQLRLEVQCRIRKGETNLSVNIAQIRNELVVEAPEAVGLRLV
jgi:hypothetical protein